MRLDNLNDDIQNADTELHGFGRVIQLVSDLTTDLPEDGERTISADDVMKLLEDLGYSAMSADEWRHLVDFRLFLSAPQADLLTECLFQVGNGRVRTTIKTYKDIRTQLAPHANCVKGPSGEKCFMAAIVALWVPLDEIPSMVFLP